MHIVSAAQRQADKRMPIPQRKRVFCVRLRVRKWKNYRFPVEKLRKNDSVKGHSALFTAFRAKGHLQSFLERQWCKNGR
jgi:hypothetical protein